MKYSESKKVHEMQSVVKLPKIEMITFNGEKTRWSEFWDSLMCAVHNNKSLSNIVKFNYLKSKLVGEARMAVAGLALSNGNYQLAVDTLKKKFDNHQEIVNIHYTQLVNLEPATNKVSSLRSLLDKVEIHIRSLEVRQQNVDQDIFVSIIRSKLPEEVLVELEIQKGVDNKWSVQNLIKQLREYVVARERASKETKSVGHRQGKYFSNANQIRYGAQFKRHSASG